MTKIEIQAFYDQNFRCCEYYRHISKTGTFETSSNHIKKNNFCGKFLFVFDVIARVSFLRASVLYFRSDVIARVAGDYKVSVLPVMVWF